AIDYIPASTFLPFEGGYLESTPVGSIHPTERIVFVMPTEEKEAIVSYAGGKININLQDRTANLSPGSQ
ncbi:MAG TPA: hypothetical protein VMU70_00180, partial [Candidatus Tyrphobacter sp.]|nr:hypothetical protein [Candidatus Tyrphobacter sp.]